MKKLLYNLLFVFFIILLIQNCSLLLLIPEDPTKKIEDITIGKPFFSRPTNIVIDENDNGIISFRDEIIQIKNLEIAERIVLKDPQEKSYVGSTAYSVDKNGDGILVYSRQDFYVDIYFYYAYPEGSQDQYLSVFNNYAVKISKNKFLTDKTKKIYATDIYYKNPSIIQFDKDNFLLYFLSNQYVKLERIKNFNSEKPDVTEYNFFYKHDFLYQDNYAILDIALNLDSQGSGWYLFKLVGNYQFERLENYKMVSSEVDELSKDSGIYYNNLDNKGNGYVVSYKYDEKEKSSKLFYQNVNNFKKNSQKNEIYTSKKDYFLPYFYSIDSRFINLDKSGNGLIFLNKDFYTKEKVGLVAKKIKDFKDIGESSISSKDRNYNCYASSINSKGNGFLITQDHSNNNKVGSKSFLLKRIKNYEIENSVFYETK